MDVLPDIEFGPVREWEDPDALVLLDFGVVEVPEFGPLVLGVPAVELVAKRKDPLLGPAFLFVPAGAAEGGIKPVLIEGLPQGLGLHDVGVDLAAVGERIDPLGPPFLIGVDD